MKRLFRLANRTPVPITTSTSPLSLPLGLQPSMDTALGIMSTSGTIFAMVDRITNAVSRVGWRLERMNRQGDGTPVTTHAALDLWAKPNPFMSRMLFLEVTQQHFELAGEMWWVVGRDARSSMPLELWPIIPSRMAPIPSPTDYIVGYSYTAPNGHKIPLGLDDVIFIRRPNPNDPYRGLSPVNTIIDDAEAVRFAGQWNRNFFVNSAEPGGVIELEAQLTDTEFREWQARWGEQHKGVAAAHRVALLERGAKWVDRKYSHRDMTFVDQRNASREVIREAFGFPKPMLGAVDDVNRANAEAAEVLFSKWVVEPRLERICQALNNHLLPLFAADPTLCFCFDDPTPEDEASEIADRDSRVAALKTLVGDLGYDSDEVLEWLEFPAFAPPEKPAPPAVAPGMQPGQMDPAMDPGQAADMMARLAAAVGVVVTAPEARQVLRLAGVPLGAVGPSRDHGSHDRVPALSASNRADIRAAAVPQELQLLASDMDRLMAHAMPEFTRARQDQIDTLVDQCRQAWDDDDESALADLDCPEDDTRDIIAAVALAMGVAAANRLVDEAARQGVNIERGEPDQGRIATRAALEAALLASGLRLSAMAAAMREWDAARDADELAMNMAERMADLSIRSSEERIGGAMWDAATDTRLDMLERAPLARYIATEVLDRNTCDPCELIDGTEMDIDQARALYGSGGYFECLGGVRCRGTVVAEWTDDQDAEWPTPD